MKLMLDDRLSCKGYPDHKIIAIIDNAIAVERMDGIIEPITWYSAEYIQRMIDNDWELNR